MKLKTRLLISFFIIILVPLALSIGLLIGASVFQGEMIRRRFGIDVRNLPPQARSLIITLLFCVVVILVITAVILSLWIYRGVMNPLVKLTKATRSIRDGNLDFTIRPDGVTEIRELCEDFEEMRKRLKQANEESLLIDAENRELISNISHDLKTPITAVKGYVEGIMDGVADTPEKMDKYIRTIYNKSIEMDSLINELTFYSKIDTNRIPYNFTRIPARAFFTDAAEELHLELEQKNISFDFRCEVPSDVEVIGDVEQLKRVINNVISNSVKYMDKPNQYIRLRVMEVGEDVQAAIEDNGKGIAAKDIGNIFDRFYRTDSSRNSSKGGSGIGLSIVQKIMADHGGRVWATSKEGEGTTMFLALRKYQENPIEDPAAAKVKENAPEKKHRGAEHKKKGNAK